MKNPAQVPKRIYMDQNAFSAIAREATTLGAIAVEAQEAGRAEVWCGPTHMLETAQVVDPELRSRISRTILDLVGGRRMWQGDEFEAVQHFVDALERNAPGAVRTRLFFNYHSRQSCRMNLGALGLLASGHTPELVDAVETLRRVKLTSQHLHARFLADPDAFADELWRTVRDGEVTDRDLFADLDKKSLQELEAETAALASDAGKLSKVDRTRLEKRRDEICRSYAALAVGPMLDHVFPLPAELDLTFNIPDLVAVWQVFQRTTHGPSLPKEIATGSKDILTDLRTTRTVLQQAVRSFVEQPNPLTYVSAQVVMRELEQRLRRGELPNAGLTFDAQHGPAVTVFDILVVLDGTLRSTLRIMADWMEEKTEGRFRAAVVANEKELKAALGD